MDDFSNVEAASRSIQSRVDAFATDAHRILGRFESAKASRVMSLDESRKQLVGLSLQQEAMFKEALECVSHGLYRAATSAAWQGFMDYLDMKLISDGFVKLRQAKPKWPQTGGIEELRDATNEYSRVELAKELGLIDKATMKSLHGHLSTRNACAHVGSYTPGLNATLGYVSDLLDRIATLSAKAL